MDFDMNGGTRSEVRGTGDGMKRTINICQPGHGASCALCCGSHNMTGGREALFAEFTRRSLHRHDRASGEAVITAGESGTGTRAYAGSEHLLKAHTDGIRCPHVGFIDADRRLIGCLIYSDCPGRAGTRGFFEYTCRNFSCAAREILDDDEILFAALITRDWYYYGPLVNSIDLLKRLYRDYRAPGNVPEGTLEAVKRRLETALYGEKPDDDNDF
jgi:hypothetical protein